MEWIVEAECKSDLVDGYGLIGRELVRCKDCVRYENGICKYWNILPWYNGYCHKGERKDDASHPFADDVMMGEKDDV